MREPSQSAPVGRIQLPRKGELFCVAAKLACPGVTPSVCSRWSQPHSPFCRYATSSPGRGKSALKGTASVVAIKLLVALDALALRATACALSVIAARCHTPPFVAARHLPPERGKSFLKGRGKSTAGSVLISFKTLATSLTAWLPLRGSWRGSA